MFKSIRVGAVRSPFTVAAVPSGLTTLPRSLSGLNRDSAGRLSDALQTPGFKGDVGETIVAGPSHMLVGLGKRDDMTSQTLRTVGARLVRALDRADLTGVKLALTEAIPAKKVDRESAGQCVAEGMGLANFRVDFFDGSASERTRPHGTLTIDSADAKFTVGMKRGLVLADAVNYARRLAATPPNICNPKWMAAEARKMARSVGLNCRVITFEQAKKMGMGGIVNVGMGSSTKPCLIVLEHRPARVAARAKGEKICLVGKTITYDTGGYSLKISNGMKGMKYDKNGGMAVLGAMRAIAKLKVPVRVTALLPTAENMVSDCAYRPDDIIRMYNKVSVEVTNTDAEGRLVLADALTYACRNVKATTIVDAATLTGGVVVALGSWCAGVFCNDDKLLGQLNKAADATGERLWRLPLWSDHLDFMRAKHADIWNSGPKRDGHPIQGAAFLSYFVDDDIPWAHIDIAGVSSVDSDSDLYVQGPTGYGVRLLTEYVSGHAG